MAWATMFLLSESIKPPPLPINSMTLSEVANFNVLGSEVIRSSSRNWQYQQTTAAHETHVDTVPVGLFPHVAIVGEYKEKVIHNEM